MPRPVSSVTRILPEICKGYNFIVIDVGPGEEKVFHEHKSANELVYVISGKIDITYINGKERVVSLKKGEAEYIVKGKVHSVTTTTKSKFIVIAKPPVFYQGCWRKFLRSADCFKTHIINRFKEK